MRNCIILLTVLLSSATSADEPGISELQQGFGKMFPANPVACDEGAPEGCICASFENKSDLPISYSRIQSCPHPVLEDVRNIKTFTADGAIIDDAMHKDGQLHGAVINWHPNGKVAAIANFEQGRQIGFARVWHDNGELSAEQQFVNGESHGPEFRYSRDGKLEWIVFWEHGNVDREESRRLSRALGIEAPFAR